MLVPLEVCAKTHDATSNAQDLLEVLILEKCHQNSSQRDMLPGRGNRAQRCFIPTDHISIRLLSYIACTSIRNSYSPFSTVRDFDRYLE
jgi:hypothetical protein